MRRRMSTLMTVVMAALLVCTALLVTGCGDKGKTKLTDEPLTAQVIGDFTKTAQERGEFFESNGWENGEPFNAYWTEENVSYENNKMTLSISEMTQKPDNANIAEYFAGEARSTHYYGYGDFQVRMKPAKIKGTASTFFTCTGPYDQWYNEQGEVIKQNDHDEIDIEFLGSDTTKVQFNYFASGVGNHEYVYDLGFDASEEFHNYGFRWTKDDITWFVDETPVYKVKRAEIKAGESWPEEPGRVIMNYWSGTQKASKWMGEFEDDFTGHPEYLWAASTATPMPDPITTKPGEQPQPSEPIPEGIEWDQNLIVPFASQDPYTVATDETEKKHTVTYTEAKKESWKNIKADIAAPDRNYFGLTLTGKTEKDIEARINIMGADGNITKKSYVSEGNTSIADGALVTVPANASVDVVIYFEGPVTNIEIMIDSTNKAPLSTNANTLEISGMKFGVLGEIINPEPSKNGGIKVNDNIVKFTGAGYTVETAEDNSDMTVKYADISGKGYTFISGDVSEFIGEENNTFTFEVTNNGAETAKIRLDIVCADGMGTPFTKGGSTEGKNNFCNVSAAYAGGGLIGSGNDYDWEGGDWFTVASGGTVTVTVTFTTGVGAKAVNMFIDSSSYDDEGTHTGELLFSKMNFSVVQA